jgi:hypothetical protein
VQSNKILIILFFISGVFFGCRPTRHIRDGQYLLIKNDIKSKENQIDKENLEKYLKQKPNRKFLGMIRFHLGLYNMSHKDSSWLKNIGEAPVLLDSDKIDRSKEQIELYLFKNGFFNATVTDSVRFVKSLWFPDGVFHKSVPDSVKLKRKKAIVEYYIDYKSPYLIRKINYATSDTGIVKLINSYQQSSLLIAGDRYNEEVFEKERERITADLKDRGYYFFTRNYITYQIDSSMQNHQVDVNLYINRVNENISGSETTLNPILDHQTYMLRNIYIQTDYNPKDPNNSVPTDTTEYSNYYILSRGKQRVIRDNVLVKNIFIKKGDMYLQRDLDFTYKRLQELNIFKFINLYFEEVPRNDDQTQYLLDLQVQLTPMEKQDFTIESEVTNTGSNIGLAGSVGYRNKNTFRGAEVLEVKLRGGLEAIPNTKTDVESHPFYVFNTFEIGPEVSMSFKKFLLPGFLERKTSRYSNPRTVISLGYNHQNSPDYIRSVTNFNYGYNWSPTSKQRFGFYPININSVQVDLDPAFDQYLQDQNDPQLTYAYQTHIISSVRLTWSTTSQTINPKKDYVNFITTFEYAFPVFKNPSRFVRIDYDLSYYHPINEYTNLVSRITMGLGIPQLPSLALPFEKSFFAGGANSMRAWYARTLGPGSYKSNIDIEQSGDIKIETNVEYRSQFFQFGNGMKLEAAAFVDAGNIWTRNEDDRRPGSEFKTGQIFEEFGIGAGLGLRFNFSFFVFRFDAAVKLRDPSYDPGNRWVYPKEKFVIGDITPNIAIGYPF